MMEDGMIIGEIADAAVDLQVALIILEAEKTHSRNRTFTTTRLSTLWMPKVTSKMMRKSVLLIAAELTLARIEEELVHIDWGADLLIRVAEAVGGDLLIEGAKARGGDLLIEQVEVHPKSIVEVLQGIILVNQEAEVITIAAKEGIDIDIN